ncbi:unnamed protein product, partial [Polarella glacialis]
SLGSEASELPRPGRGEELLADAFVIHGTVTWLNEASGAANVDSRRAKAGRLQFAQRQASALNGVCRIYAPYYSAATLGSGLSAFDRAYQDVRAAFDAYLRLWHGGRPIILMGHSQGSVMGLRLLWEFGDRIRPFLAGAYLPGICSFPGKIPTGISVASRLGELGSIAVWNTVQDGATIKDNLVGKYAAGSKEECLCTLPQVDAKRSRPSPRPGATARVLPQWQGLPRQRRPPFLGRYPRGRAAPSRGLVAAKPFDKEQLLI